MKDSIDIFKNIVDLRETFQRKFGEIAGDSIYKEIGKHNLRGCTMYSIHCIMYNILILSRAD